MTEVFTISSDKDGLTSPQSAPPGRATFSASTTVDGLGWVGLARFKAAPDWLSFQTVLRDVVCDDGIRIRRGTPALDAAVTLLGGAVIHPGLPADFTVDLAPGHYGFFDYPDTVASDSPRRCSMVVRGDYRAGQPDNSTATVRATCDAGGRPRFEVTGTLRTGRPVRFVNAMAEPQFAEFVLLPITDRVGPAELTQYISRFRNGSSEWPPDPPFDVTRGTGCLPLSAGRQAVMSLPAGPGRYLLASWLKSAVDGVRMVKLGQWTIVEIGQGAE